jgi:Predicted ATPase of the PP-loop superfamily implicated in cell cycle control
MGVFNLIDKVLNTIRNNKMFSVGDKIVVAVSGGPDSICLFTCIAYYKG